MNQKETSKELQRLLARHSANPKGVGRAVTSRLYGYFMVGDEVNHILAEIDLKWSIHFAFPQLYIGWCTNCGRRILRKQMGHTCLCWSLRGFPPDDNGWKGEPMPDLTREEHLAIREFLQKELPKVPIFDLLCLEHFLRCSLPDVRYSGVYHEYVADFLLYLAVNEEHESRKARLT